MSENRMQNPGEDLLPQSKQKEVHLCRQENEAQRGSLSGLRRHSRSEPHTRPSAEGLKATS